MNEIDIKIKQEISKKENVSIKQIDTVLEMINEGSTVPFIARYRKEQTGGLDEDKIREIYKEWEYSKNLADRKEDVIRLIDEKGLLTEDIKNQIINANKLVDVEDIYRPFKEKKKTKATEAIKKGLEPLAKQIMSFPTKGDINTVTSKYINDEVKSSEEAIEGASHIIAEWISDNSFYRKYIRREVFRKGTFKSKKKPKAIDENNLYEIYHDYEELVKYVKPHRVLAMNRGEKEKILSVSIKMDKEIIHEYLNGKVIRNNESFVVEIVKEAIKDSYKRLIYPSIEREIRSELNERAEEQAINIFSVNLKNLLLTPPMKDKVVLGVDPAFRTGCKLCILSNTGKVLEKGVIYPHQKSKTEKVPQKRIDDSKKTVINIIYKYNVDIIAIGNGTASRETEQFIADIIKEISNEGKLSTKYLIVSEAGASVYSASKIAQEEFPDFSVEERSAASIGRRLQDPLSELVKIDPKSIGVGQYQHDVTQSKLNESLDYVVLSSVNSVGVDVNTASKELLKYISGLNNSIATNIVKYREGNGKFSSRKDLLNVPKLGKKAFEQAAGFLRIIDGNNILDLTSIHPESYKIAEHLLKDFNISKEELGKKELIEKLDKLNINDLIERYNTDKYTLEDIIKSFKEPLRDPRDDFEKPELKSDVLHIEDLKKGMELHGIVRNVVDFGAFVDIGLKNDGLVHISRLSNNFVKHPMDVLSVGDIVNVYIHEVNTEKQNVSLSMIKN